MGCRWRSSSMRQRSGSSSTKRRRAAAMLHHLSLHTRCPNPHRTFDQPAPASSFLAGVVMGAEHRESTGAAALLLERSRPWRHGGGARELALMIRYSFSKTEPAAAMPCLLLGRACAVLFLICVRTKENGGLSATRHLVLCAPRCPFARGVTGASLASPASRRRRFRPHRSIVLNYRLP